MASVTFPVAIGGDGSTVSDDSNASTGLGNGGHRTRFVPALSNLVGIGNLIVPLAQNALNAAGTSATSTSSLTVGTGSKSLTLAQTGKAFAVGQWVNITNTAAPATNYMVGAITAFNSGTGAMTVNVTFSAGSGTLASWAVHPASPGVANLSNDAGGNVVVNGALEAADGTVSAPSLSFSTDPDTGFYTGGVSGQISVTSNGAEIARFTSDRRLRLIGLSGATALSQSHPGLFLGAASMDGTSKFTPGVIFGSTDAQFTTNNPKALAGLVGVATEAYAADTDAGMGIDAWVSANDGGASPTQVTVMSLRDTGVTLGARLLSVDGAAATPALTFSADPDTGFYRLSANTIGIALAGVAAGSLGANSMILNGPTSGSATFTVAGATGGAKLIGASPATTAFLDLDVVPNTASDTATIRLFRQSAAGSGSSVSVFEPNTSTLTLQVMASTGQVRGSLGSVTVPAFSFIGDTNTGMYSPGADQLGLATAGNLRLAVTAAGEALFGGVTSPVVVRTSGTNVTPRLQVHGTAVSPASGMFGRYNADASGPMLFLAKGRTATVGDATTPVSADDTLGTLSWQAADGVQFTEGARIMAAAAALASADAAPTRLTFWTNGGASVAPTERMRIDQSGNVSIGRAVAAARLTVDAGSSTIPSTTATALVAASATAATAARLSVISGNTGAASLAFGDSDADAQGLLSYDHITNGLTVHTAGAAALALSSAGALTLSKSGAALGFAVGAGGSQTQVTSKATSVTLDRSCGVITMHNASLNANTAVSFTLTNSQIASTDVIVTTIISGATAGAYLLAVDQVSNGSCRVTLRNLTGGALGEAVSFSFVVLKVATT